MRSDPLSPERLGKHLANGGRQEQKDMEEIIAQLNADLAAGKIDIPYFRAQMEAWRNESLIRMGIDPEAVCGKCTPENGLLSN